MCKYITMNENILISGGGNDIQVLSTQTHQCIKKITLE